MQLKKKKEPFHLKLYENQRESGLASRYWSRPYEKIYQMTDKFNRADLLVSFFFFLSSFVFSFLSLSHIRLMKLSLVGKGPTLKSLRIAKMSLHKCNQTLLCWRIKVSSRFTNGVKLWYIFWYSMLSYYRAVDGGWGRWGPWSKISLTCGIGLQAREREM